MLISAAKDGSRTLPTLGANPAAPVRDAIRRAMRRPDHRWVLLVLHLSRLAAISSRPHHARIAQTVLNESAGERGGQLFRLPHGDFVLLLPSPDGAIAPVTLLTDLFAGEALDIELLLSRWLLPANLAQAEAYLDASATMATVPTEPGEDADLAAVARICEQIDPAHLIEACVRQTGVVLAASGPTRVLPLFREISVAADRMMNGADAALLAAADPFLHRHVASRLEVALMERLAEMLDRGGPPPPWITGPGRPALHLNAGTAVVSQPAFDRLEAAAATHDLRIGIEVALVEAMADTSALARLRERTQSARFSLILDDVSAHALPMLWPAALGADLLKLTWSPSMARNDVKLDRAIAAFGANRIVLASSNGEKAIRWGLARGIRRFQGSHVDVILAAGRMAVCDGAGACTMRLCLEREAAAATIKRAGCGHHDVLDAAAPSPEFAQ